MKKTILTAIAGIALMSGVAMAEGSTLTNEYIDGSKAGCQSIRTNTDVIDYERVKTDSEYARGVQEAKVTFSNNI